MIRLSKHKFLTLDQFLNSKGSETKIKSIEDKNMLLFYSEDNKKQGFLVFNGEIVLELNIINLTPKGKRQFRVTNPISNEKMITKRALSKDQREIYVYRIGTESKIIYLAYSIQWDLTHWSGFESLQEEEFNYFDNFSKAKNWLESVSGIKITDMGFLIKEFSNDGSDLHLPCNLGLEFKIKD